MAAFEVSAPWQTTSVVNVQSPWVTSPDRPCRAFLFIDGTYNGGTGIARSINMQISEDGVTATQPAIVSVTFSPTTTGVFAGFIRATGQTFGGNATDTATAPLGGLLVPPGTRVRANIAGFSPGSMTLNVRVVFVQATTEEVTIHRQFVNGSAREAIDENGNVLPINGEVDHVFPFTVGDDPVRLGVWVFPSAPFDGDNFFIESSRDGVLWELNHTIAPGARLYNLNTVPSGSRLRVRAANPLTTGYRLIVFWIAGKQPLSY
jgi:hypothetical protein